MNSNERWCVICAVIAGLIICVLIDNPQALNNFIDNALSIPMEERR